MFEAIKTIENLGTYLALVWLVSRVRSNVRYQLILGIKCLGTRLALVISLQLVPSFSVIDKR